MVTEAVRIATLRGYGVLDTPNEPEFDRIVTAIAGSFGVRHALVSFIDEHRQWYKARHGVDADAVPRTISFCTHSLGTDAVTVIPDARTHPRFGSSPFVAGNSGVRFYAAAPIKAPNRARIGTVCIFDPVPRPLGMSEREKRQLAGFATDVVDALERRRAVHAAAPVIATIAAG